MTGPEHYKEAERLLALVMTEHTYDNGVPVRQSLTEGILPLAQVHAALALAAATALQPRGYGDSERQAWKAAGRRAGGAQHG